jgi:hypothetical protein
MWADHRISSNRLRADNQGYGFTAKSFAIDRKESFKHSCKASLFELWESQRYHRSVLCRDNAT